MKLKDEFKIFTAGVQDLGFGTAVKSEFDQLNSSMSASTKNFLKVSAGLIAITVALKAFEALDDKFALTFDTAQEHVEETATAYKNTISEIDSLNSKLETTQNRISELKEQDSLTIIEQTELDNLERENALLETQLEIKKNLAQAQAREAAEAAKHSIDYRNQSVTSDEVILDENGEYNPAMQKRNVDRKQYVKQIVSDMEEQQKLIEEAQNKLSGSLSDEDSEKYTKQFEDATAELQRLKTEGSTIVADLSQESASFYDSYGNVVEGFENDVKNVNEAIDLFNNFDLSPAEKELANIESFFDGSTEKNLLKEKLLDIAKSSKDADAVSKALGKMGVNLAKSGLTADALNKYFAEMADSANEAAEATEKVNNNLTMGDIETAFDSKNAGDDYVSFAEYLEKAKELFDQGLVGTDEFKSVAEMMSYNVDSSTKSFKKNYDKIKNYFKEDKDGNLTGQGVHNFLVDLQNLDKGYAKFNKETGKWDINMKNTAKAAKEMGMGVGVFEAMLGRIQDYDNVGDFKFTSAIKEFNEAKTSLEGLQSILDEMEYGDQKTALEEKLAKWSPMIEKAEGDLASLPDEVVTQLKFEYDIAQVQKIIDELNSTWEKGDKSSATGAARNVAQEKYREEREKQTGYTEKSSKAYKTSYDKIAEIEKSMRQTNDEEAIRNFQEQENAILKMQSAFQDIRAGGEKISWSKYLNSDEAKDTMEEIIASGELTRDELEELFNITLPEIKAPEITEPTHKKMEIGVGLSKDKVEEELSEVTAGSTIEFTADLDGVERQVTALKEEDGTITYTAEVNGESVEVVLNQDGTIDYKIASQEQPRSGIAGLFYKWLSQEQAKNSEAGVKYESIGQEKPKDKEAGVFYRIKGVIGNIKNFITGYTELSGTAHLSGTNHASGTLSDSSFIKDKWRTKKSEVALVGEEGQELVATRDGYFYTVGDNGAEFRGIPAGSVVFDANQTKELLTKGHIRGRGKAHLSGTAYLGSASGSFSFDGGAKKYNAGSKTTSAKNNNKSAKDTTSTSKKIKEVFDKIEILISRMERSFEHLTDSIETYSYDLSKQMSISDKAIDTAKGNIDVLEKAKNRYLKEANKVNLSKAWKEDVRNGEVDLTKVRSQKLLDNIKKYQDYYEKYLDTEDKILEAQQDLLDLAVEKIENIDKYYGNRFTYDENIGRRTDLSEFQKVVSTLREELEKQVSDGVITKHSNEWYDAMELIAEREQELLEATWERYEDVIDYLSRATDVLSDSLEYKEARGEKLSESDYASQIDINNKKIKELYDAILQYEKDISVYDFGTEKYDELADKISDAKSEIYGLLSTNEELEDSIWDVRFTEPFDELINGIDQTIESTDNLRALLNEDAFFDKNGVITEDGLANISLLNQSLNESKQKVAEYTEGLKILDEAYANGTISESKYKEAQAEMISGLQDSVASVQDYKNELIDLYKQQAQNEADYLTDIIDKYAEAKDKKAQYWDYNKKIQNQTKSINMLKAELAVLEGSNNEADIARAKKLRAEIAEAEDSLAEEKRNHSLDMQQDGYDAMKDDIAQILEDTEYEIAHNAEKQESVISSMLGNVVSMYADAYGKINQIIYDTGFIGNSSSTQNITNSGTESGISAQVEKGNTHQSQITPSASVSETNTSSINANFGNDKVIDHISKSVDKDNRPVAELSLSKSSISLEEGKSTSVTVSIRPSDAANKKLSWTSSNSKIATVSNGKITAKSPGVCVVTASTKDGSGISKKINVTVTPKPKAKAESVKTDDGKKSTSNVGDGKAKVGDKVTFKSGRYYYDSYGKNPAGNKYLGKSVYITKINKGSNRPYHISTGKKLGNGDLGWVTLSQLKGYAKGSSGILKDQLARTQEEGLEFILRDGSVLTPLSEGDKILTAAQTRNMMDWAKVDPKDYILPNGLNPSNYINVKQDGGVRIEQHYDSLLTVNGDIDKDALPPLKDLLEQSYRYNMDKMYKEANKLGFKRVR